MQICATRARAFPPDRSGAALPRAIDEQPDRVGAGDSRGVGIRVRQQQRASGYVRSSVTCRAALDSARRASRERFLNRFRLLLAMPSSKCSQLSSTNSRSLPRKCAHTVSIRLWPTASFTPKTCASALGTSRGSRNGARSTNQTPSRYASKISAVACRTRRVLPTPPAPVSVNNRVPGNSRLISAISFSRPTKAVSTCGRWCAYDGPRRSRAKGDGDTGPEKR